MPCYSQIREFEHACFISRERGITVLLPICLVDVYQIATQDGSQIIVLDGNRAKGVLTHRLL